MPSISIKITNLPQIKAAFSAAPAKMTRGLNTAIQKTVFAIEGDSMRNTPVLTGRLRASHRTLFSNLRGEVGPNTNYAIFVHEGTRYMKARPFLLQAVKSNEQKAQGFFKEETQKVLDEIARET